MSITARRLARLDAHVSGSPLARRWHGRVRARPWAIRTAGYLSWPPDWSATSADQVEATGGRHRPSCSPSAPAEGPVVGVETRGSGLMQKIDPSTRAGPDPWDGCRPRRVRWPPPNAAWKWLRSASSHQHPTCARKRPMARWEQATGPHGAAYGWGWAARRRDLPGNLAQPVCPAAIDRSRRADRVVSGDLRGDCRPPAGLGLYDLGAGHPTEPPSRPSPGARERIARAS